MEDLTFNFLHNATELCKLGAKYSANSYHMGYTPIYDSLFRSLRKERLNILVIGQTTDATILMLKEYFQHSKLTWCIENIEQVRDNLRIPSIILSRIKPKDELLYREQIRFLKCKFDIIIVCNSDVCMSSQRHSALLYDRLHSSGILIFENLENDIQIDNSKKWLERQWMPDYKLLILSKS